MKKGVRHGLCVTWSPLFGALSAVVLALLLVVGHPSLHRMTLSLAGASVLSLLVELALLFVLYGQSYPERDLTTYQAVGSVSRAVDSLTSLLALAAWVLLLYAASQAQQRGRLVALAVVLTLALGLQLSVTSPLIPLLGSLKSWASQHLQWGVVVIVALSQIAAVAALVGALVTPTQPATTPAPARDA
jgi:hypothetical protein